MWFLIGVLILIGFILTVYLYAKYKLKQFLQIPKGMNLKEFTEQEKLLSQQQPKSVGSMDRIYLESIKRDFKEININEIKRMAEEHLLEYFEAIEKKDSSSIICPKVKKEVDQIIKEKKRATYRDINFHNTVLNRYENHNGIATIHIAVSLEYYYQDQNQPRKKVQDRYRIEFIYITDFKKVKKSQKRLGLNCPNCGSPLTNEKECAYCHTKSIDIVRKVWTWNDLRRY